MEPVSRADSPFRTSHQEGAEMTWVVHSCGDDVALGMVMLVGLLGLIGLAKGGWLGASSAFCWASWRSEAEQTVAVSGRNRGHSTTVRRDDCYRDHSSARTSAAQRPAPSRRPPAVVVVTRGRRGAAQAAADPAVRSAPGLGRVTVVFSRRPVPPGGRSVRPGRPTPPGRSRSSRSCGASAGRRSTGGSAGRR